MGEFAYIDTLLEGVLEKSGQPVKRGTMAHEHDIYALLSDSAAQRRDLEALERFAPRLAELAERDQHHLYRGVAQRALGVAARLGGDYANAGHHFSKALSLFEELDTRWQIGITLCAMAELDQARSDPTSQEDHLNRAVTLFQVVGAVPDAERAKHLMDPGETSR
jgi:hypothetical protein